MKTTNEILKEVLGSITKVDFKKSKTSTLDGKLAGELTSQEIDALRAGLSTTPDEIAVIVADEVKKVADTLGYGLMANEAEEVYIYDKDCWRLVPTTDFKHFLTDSYMAMGAEAKKANTPACAQRLYAQAAYSYYRPIPKKRNKAMVNAANLTVLLDSGPVQTKPHTPEDMFFYCLPYNYDPDAKAPLWNKFLSEVLPDQSVQTVLQEFYGVCLAPNLKVEKALVNLGTGSNGKSVAMEVMSHVLGEDNVCHYGINGLCDERSTTRILLQNKLLNAATEFSGKIWDNGFFKQLVSGEPIEARRLYQDPITMIDYARLEFNCNRMPQSRDSSDGFLRRLLIVEFGVKITPDKADPDLSKKLKKEASGILNWCIEGLKRYIANGQKFSKSDKIADITSELMEDLDSVSQFQSEKMLKPSKTKKRALSTLHSEYMKFCSDKGLEVDKKADFKRKLEDLGFTIKRERDKEPYEVWCESALPSPFNPS